MKRIYILILTLVFLSVAFFLYFKLDVNQLTKDDIESIRLQFETALLEDYTSYNELSQTPFGEYYWWCNVNKEADYNQPINVEVSVESYESRIRYGYIWFRYTKSCSEMSGKDILVEVKIKKNHDEWKIISVNEYMSSSAEPNWLR